ncbi:tetratricopeptide repeat protein [Sulfurospirillum arcachonense]|uniref:tetratricopeptide repeat protein n=1 Tax=Sulfurospirillum arcachonense TaxID=57666 RepID=UPI00046AC0D2|nr:tetratricopeptide repeat protein [Sulfurospirillum arcachonense]
MKKILLLLFFIATQLFSLTIVLNSAKENGTAYAILHIEDTQSVDCQIVPQDLDKKIYLCKFNKIVKTPISAKKMSLVNIDFLEKEKEFYIRIEPKVKSKLIPVGNALYANKEVTGKQNKKNFKHWSILLYEKSPFLQDEERDSIDFPIMYSKNLKPYIGALDLNGAPISYAQSKDIRLYLRLKKSYKQKKYRDVVEDSIDAIKKFPQTIFKSEFLLYRLKALDKGMEENESDIAVKFDSNDIVREGKVWIKSFPSDNNIPEVIMLIAKAYLKMGFKSDANYFMDILISEHEDSPFTKKAILVFADSLYNSRKKDKAIKLYQDVLYSAKDLDIAAEAAIRLSNSEMNRGKIDSAREYLVKVLDANKEYLLKDRVASFKFAKKLASKNLYDVASKVADVLLDGLKKTDENREALLRDSGLWHTKANNIKEAYARLQQYLKEYKNGDFVKEVQTSLDELFFELNETNETKLANYYDTLIKKYKNKIGDKAVVEKAKLFLSQKKYKDVLKMQNMLEYVSEKNATTTNKFVQSAADALVKLSIKKDECMQAVNYIETYKLDIETFDKANIFNCLIRTSRFEKAKKLSEKYIKESNLNKRVTWLERYLLSQYKLNKYASAVDVGDDIISLSKSLKIKPKNKTLQMIFFSLMKLEKLEKAIEIAKLIEKNSPNELNNSDVFIEIVKKAVDDRNDLLLKEYANKIIALQKKHNSYVHTPIVELSLIGALQRLEKPKEALGIAKSLLNKNIALKDKTRAYYNAGELSMKLKQNEEAKKYFKQCADIKVKSSWKDICEQNLKLF